MGPTLAQVTGGCTAFLLGGEVISKHAKKSTDTSMYGVLLMLGYLGFDGFTSTFQDKLFKGYKMETYNQMLYVNLTSATVRSPLFMRGCRDERVQQRGRLENMGDNATLFSVFLTQRVE
jgi:hypothetical protein